MMTFQEKMRNIPLPSIYLRNQTECFLDPYRKKLIQVTPEEKVRQKVALYFERELGVPADTILLEEPMAHYGVTSKDRADIIIHKYIFEENLYKPIAVIECKSDSVILIDRTCEQAKRYADVLECDYFFATNGIDLIGFKYIEGQNEYVPLKQIPSYSEMLHNKYEPLPPVDLPPRVPFDLLSHEDVISEYVNGWDIGKDTPLKFVPFIINLLECFMDTCHSVILGKYDGFEIIKDYGHRLLTYGNAGGGNFTGPYRSLIIKDYNGNHQFISFGFSTYTRTEVNNAKEKTALCVAIDDYDKMHHALQITLDDHLIEHTGSYTIWHNGRIGVGNCGSGKVSELKILIKKRCPKLLENDRNVLGRIRSDHLLYVDNDDVREFICNLICYSLIRDEYRNVIKNQRNIKNEGKPYLKVTKRKI